VQAERSAAPKPRGEDDVRVLAAIALLGALLRFWTIGDGAPFVAQPDEWRLADSALAVVRTNDWHPASFAAGPLAISVHAVATTVRFLLGAVEGAWPSVAAVWPGQFLVSSRLLSALFGVLTIIVVYRIGARWTPRTAAVAALLAACSPSLVTASQLATHDALLVLLVALTWLAVARAAESGRALDATAAGAAAGLAAATAFSGFAAVLIAMTASVGAAAAGPPHDASTRIRRLALVAGAALLAFAIASPYTLFDLPGYLNAAAAALAERSAHARAGGLVPLALSLADHVALLPRAWDPARASGVLGFALAAVGVLHLFGDLRNPRRPLALAGLLTLSVYGWVALAAGDPSRATWPLVPALCVVTAAGLDALRQRAQRRDASPRARRALVLATGLLVAAACARTLDRDWRRQRDTPDERAASWLVTRLQPGDRVVIEGDRLRLPSGYAVTAVPRLIDYSPDQPGGGTTYLAASARVSNVFLREPQRFPDEAAAYRALFSRFAIAASFAADDPGASAVTILTEAPDRRSPAK
jgi:4-amino-4-deoxy-L-arabinose transferase-like glycosyltransferase